MTWKTLKNWWWLRRIARLGYGQWRPVRNDAGLIIAVVGCKEDDPVGRRLTSGGAL